MLDQDQTIYHADYVEMPNVPAGMDWIWPALLVIGLVFLIRR